MKKKPFNPWPWFAPAVLLATVLANVVLIHLAETTDDSIVLEEADRQ